MKQKIFIDFEAISSPFNRELKIKSDFPYAYTLGIIEDNKMKTKTFIVDFAKDEITLINDVLRRKILRDVRSLLKDRFFVINRNTVEFISFAPALETKILKQVYAGIRVIDIAEGLNVSLTYVTQDHFEEVEYFTYFKKWVTKNIDDSFVKKRNLIHDGALAALAGYILYVNHYKNNTKWYNDSIDIEKLQSELFLYSKDDVMRMKYIFNNKEKFRKLAKERDILLRKKSKLMGEVKREKMISKYLKNLPQKITVEDVLKILDKDIKENTQKIEDLNSEIHKK